MISSPLHEAARAYIARGWAVFPLKVRDKTPMIGPSRPGARDGGFHLASKAAAQIDEWWKRWPHANIGLRCGEESGVFVLDLDGEEAECALAALQRTHGLLPLTLEQRTGKGRHLLFRHVAGVRNRGGGYLVDGKRVACKGFDVRGEGGYIVAPPSVHPSGRVYAWTTGAAGYCLDEIVGAPAWLIEAIVPPVPKAPALTRAYDRTRGGRATAYGEKALDSACRRIAAAQHGTRHNTLAGEAAAIGELVAGGEIERGYAERALVNAATAMMAGQVTQRELSKVTWGLAVGQSRPRAVTKARQSARAPAPNPQSPIPNPDVPKARLAIAPPDERATLIVVDEDIGERAVLAWLDARGGPYGLFVARDLDALVGGMARNAGGFDDWRTPAPDPARPAATMCWKGRVLVVLPELDGFTVSRGTKWERFISSERCAQAMGLIASHWWRRAGACDVQAAILPRETQAA